MAVEAIGPKEGSSMVVRRGNVSPHMDSSSMVAILVMLVSRRKERDRDGKIERGRGQKESGGTSPKVSGYVPPGRYLELSESLCAYEIEK